MTQPWMETLKTGREERGEREGRGRGEGGEREGGREGGRRQNTLPEMPPVLLIGRVEPTHQSGTSYQCSPCTAPEEGETNGRREEKENRCKDREGR